MQVTTLGTASPYPRPGNPCSSFLVQTAGGSRIWLDAGAGTLAALLVTCPLAQLDAVWISHTHADHFSDLAVTYYALAFTDVHRPPLPVFGPPGWVQRLRAVLTHDPARPSPLERVLDVHEVTDRLPVAVEDSELTPVLLQHDAPNYGVRLRDGDGVVLAYTGDTGPCNALGVLARDADLLISEADDGTLPASREGVHLTASEAAQAAEAASVRQLLLTHLGVHDAQRCVEAAIAAGPTPVTAATPGSVLVP